ncbi:MAG: hypothetical protein QOJ79_1314 [Actinomycetota bacterium]|nr:hypothetical protein [Actinomycetota bacterium]
MRQPVRTMARLFAKACTRDTARSAAAATGIDRHRPRAGHAGRRKARDVRRRASGRDAPADRPGDEPHQRHGCRRRAAAARGEHHGGRAGEHRRGPHAAVDLHQHRRHAEPDRHAGDARDGDGAGALQRRRSHPHRIHALGRARTGHRRPAGRRRQDRQGAAPRADRHRWRVGGRSGGGPQRAHRRRVGNPRAVAGGKAAHAAPHRHVLDHLDRWSPLPAAAERHDRRARPRDARDPSYLPRARALERRRAAGRR